MADDEHRVPARFLEAARAIAFGVWIVAALGVPAALILRSYETLLLIVILVVVWQLLAALLTWRVLGRRRRTRRRFRYRLTGWGLTYCAIAATFCFVALQWGLNLIYLTAAFLVGGAVYAAVLPRLMLGRTEMDWSVPEHVFAGNPFPVEVTLRNERRLLSAFGLRVGLAGTENGAEQQVVRLRPGGRRLLVIKQFLPLRGLHKLRPVAVRTEFPLGVVEATMHARFDRDMLVLPRVGRINEAVLRRQKGGEAKWLQNLRRKDEQGEFRSLREYRHGDDPRHIHWPTSARLNKLHIREFERLEMHRLLVVLDAYVPAGEPEETRARLERFEKAVSFVAALSALMTERGVFHAFVSRCPDLVALPYDLGAGHFYAILEALALAEAGPAHPPGELASALSLQEVRTGGICLVTPGPLPRAQWASALGPLARNSVCIDVSESDFDAIYSL